MTTPQNQAPEVQVAPDNSCSNKKCYQSDFESTFVTIKKKGQPDYELELRECDPDERAKIVDHLTSLANINPVTGKPTGLRSSIGSDEEILSHILHLNDKLLSKAEIKALKLPGRVLSDLVADGIKICAMDTKAEDREKKD